MKLSCEIVRDLLPLYAEELARLSGLPVKFTAAKRDIAERLGGIRKGFLPMDLQKKII